LGEKVKVLNSAGINLRETPGGRLLSNLRKSSVLKVLEVVARTGENKIYYKVKSGSKTGYIYSGTLLPVDTLADWTQPTR
jgi:hypothetical protein